MKNLNNKLVVRCRFRTAMILIAAGVISCSGGGNLKNKIHYPATAKVNQVDNYSGTEISDPYRWLEDDNSEETKKWVTEENKVTFDYLSKIPFRKKIKNRLSQLWNFERRSVPFRKKNYYFYYRNDGTQNLNVLYYMEGLAGTPKILIDPNTFSADGTVSLAQAVVSDDARYIAYAIATGGSDWEEIFVLDIEKNRLLNDHLQWIKFSGIAWHGDGFYYSRYDAPPPGQELSQKNEYHKIYYHRLGDEQGKDRLIYRNTGHPLRNYSLSVTESKRFAILYESETTSGEGVYCRDFTKNDSAFHLIAPGFDYEYQVVDNIDEKLLVRTNQDAPRYMLALIDPEKPGKENWKIIIPEQKDVLEDVELCNYKIAAKYMQDASNHLYVYDLNGQRLNEIPLPGICTAGDFQSEKDDSMAFYSCVSFTLPTTVYKYNINRNASEIFFKPKLDFNDGDFITEQKFYMSDDGTKIPMFITHNKNMELNGNNPLLLYGYGGFNIPNLPNLKIDRLVWLENGGVYVVANIRGGGEYGEEWHLAGTKLKKQNVFDDFIAAAGYLIKEKYTSSQKLAIQGRSNGGLLVGACMTQRPDLFKVALPGVGVLDMLRFHKFTIGWAWVGDYGSSDDPEMFRYLLSYSPLHNIKENTEYPATLAVTADHDDRVVPAHSFKFISTLQEKQSGNNPVLIRIETMAGHGSGKPVSKQIEEDADILSFTFYNMGVAIPEN